MLVFYSLSNNRILLQPYTVKYCSKYYYDSLFEIIIYSLARAATAFPRACVMMDLKETHFYTVNNIVYFLLYYYYFTVINILIIIILITSNSYLDKK